MFIVRPFRRVRPVVAVVVLLFVRPIVRPVDVDRVLPVRPVVSRDHRRRPVRPSHRVP